MFLRNITLAAALAAATLALPNVAPAATVTITMTPFGTASNATNQNNARTAQDAFMSTGLNGGYVVTENFEGFTACNRTNATTCASGPLTTAVGTFSGIGPAFSGGGSQIAPTNNIIVRSNNPNNTFGRVNLTPGGSQWLDSNDMNGISWLVPGSATLNAVRRLSFLLTDVDDVGNIDFSIRANGGTGSFNTVLQLNNNGLPNGTLHLVTMLFSAPVSSFTVDMINGRGDGFGADRFVAAVVPLPAAGLLLLGALGGLAVLRRRRPAA